MIHTKKLLNYNKPLVYIKSIDDRTVMIDNNYVYYQLNKNSYMPDKRIVIQKDTTVHEFTKKFDISDEFLCVYPKKDPKSLIFIKDESGLKIDSNLTLEENIVITKFSNDSKIVVIGGDNGTIWLYNVPLKKIIYTLDPKSDEISSITFSDDDKFVAIGSFNKKIEVYDTSNWKKICKIESDSVPEDLQFCHEGLYLYSVHRDGSILGFDIVNEEKIYKKVLGQHWLTVIKRYKSKNYAIVGARDNIFMIIELKTGKIVKKASLQNKGLNSVDFGYTDLLMAFADGNILVCDMEKNRNEVLVSLKIEDYAKAKELIDENILLYLDGTIEQLYDHGEKVLKEIVKLIELGSIENAINLAEPFLGDEEFNSKFNSYMSKREEITKFINYVQVKDFAAAYRLSNEYEYIKELKKYHELEDFWHQCFNDAKNLIAKNPNDSAAKIRAKGKLQNFLNVSCKRDSIKNLLENSIIFFQADTLAKEKKFAQFFALCQEYSFLEDTKIYNKVMSVAGLLLTNITKAIQQKNFSNANMTAKKLLSFTPIKSEVEKKIAEISIIEDFNKAVKDKNYKIAFELVEENKFLESLFEYNNILNEFLKEDDNAKEYAIAGDVAQTFESLRRYLTINHLKERVAFTVKLAYLNSMEPSKYEKPIEWKKTFSNYIELYGKDHHLQTIAAKNSVDSIFHSIKENENSNGYKDRAFKKEVVVLS